MASAPHRIIVFSDYTDTQLKPVDERIRKLMKKYPGQIKYDIMASPKNPDCNPRSSIVSGSVSADALPPRR